MSVNTIDKAAKILLFITIVMLPFITVSSSLLSVAPTTKTTFFVVGLSGAFILWIVARLISKKLIFPKSFLLGSGILILVASILSTLTSESFRLSFFGEAFERDTTFVYIILIATILGVATIYNRISHLLYLQLGILLSFSALAVLQLLRVLVGSNSFFPSFFSTDASVILLGSWNDFAIFAGLSAIVSVVAIVRSYFAGWMHWCMYVVLGLSLASLLLVNKEVVWSILLLVLVMFGAYVVWRDTPESIQQFSPNHESKRKKLVRKLAPVLVTIAVGIFGLLIVGQVSVSEVFGVNHVAVRPSWEGTVDIGKEVYSRDMLLGTGPNTFVEQWNLYKSKDINLTSLWNVEYTFGVGFIPTTFITGGLLVTLSWILFFAAFIFGGFKMVTRKVSNTSIIYLAQSFYLVALYLWLVSIFYVPQITMLLFACVATGAFVSISNIAGFVKNKQVDLHINSPADYIANGVLACGIILAVYLSFTISTQNNSLITLQQSVNSLASGDMLAAEAYLAEAKTTYQGDESDQVQSNISILKLGQVADSRQQGMLIDETEIIREIQKAITSAQAAVDKNPRSYTNWLLLAGVYENLLQYGLEDAGPNARSSYASAQALSPQDPAVWLRRARLEIMLGNTEITREYLQESINLKEDYLEAYYVLSQLEISQGNISEAIIATEQSVLLSPSNPIILFQLGILLYSNDEYDKTIPVLERLLSIEPDFANALYYLGLSYEFEGEKTKTLAAFQSIQTLNPQNEHIQNIISSLEEGKTAREVVEQERSGSDTPDLNIDPALLGGGEINLE
jgi:cytochrome c-type biogenesis protein CcmH/NrfG/uncharacterized membrane protein